MPDTSPEADLVFLPWVRQGASAALDAPDTLGARQPASIGTMVTLQINGGNDVRVPVQLMGPGQVTGIDPRQVIRTDPARNARNFEPNYFPLVEFDDPSLPWLFTPAARTARRGCGHGSCSSSCRACARASSCARRRVGPCRCCRSTRRRRSPTSCPISPTAGPGRMRNLPRRSMPAKTRCAPRWEGGPS